jgi:hypothetical protein
VFAGCIVVCVSCVVWIWPVLGIGAATMVSMIHPLLWIVTGPLVMLLALATAWIITSVMAPIPLFYRAWSWAFVHRLDPSVPLWSTPAETAPEAQETP